MGEKRNGCAGFTLVEVLVAFAVLALAAGALMAVFGSGPDRMLYASNQRVAVLAAKSLLARVATEQLLLPGHYEGSMADGVRWDLSIKPFPAEKPPGATSVTVPYLVSVRTIAGGDFKPAEVTLTTVRLRVTNP